MCFDVSVLDTFGGGVWLVVARAVVDVRVAVLVVGASTRGGLCVLSGVVRLLALVVVGPGAGVLRGCDLVGPMGVGSGGFAV